MKTVSRIIYTSVICYLVIQCIVSSQMFAKPAELEGDSEYIGKCNSVYRTLSQDSNRKVEPKNQEQLCESNVIALHFMDGYTSIQFDLIAKIKELKQSVSFVGPIWFKFDDVHESMVISEVVFATVPANEPLKSTSVQKNYSGFCLLTLERPDGPVSSIMCQYLAGADYKTFTLEDISSREHSDIRN